MGELLKVFYIYNWEEIKDVYNQILFKFVCELLVSKEI